MVVDRLALQEKHLALLALHMRDAEPSFRFTNEWFPYTSGEVGPYYVQSAAIMSDGEHYHEAISALAALVQERGLFTAGSFISGGETRDWIFSGPVAVQLHLPHVMIYKDGKVLGEVPSSSQGFHVADLNNEGSSIRDKWVPALKKYDADIACAFFYVDRREDGVHVLKDLNIPSESVIPLDARAWELLLDWNVISSAQYRALSERMEDKQAWGQNALRVHTGKLEAMLRDPKTRAKGENILLKGYPEIKDELLDRMQERGYVHIFGGAQ